MIARAAYEIGLDRVTMKAVADRLGRERARAVPPRARAATTSCDSAPSTPPRRSKCRSITASTGRRGCWSGRHYSHDAFVAQPALLGQFLNGSLGVERMVTHVDAAIGVLTRQGFSITEAIDAYEIVSDCALGAAVGEIRATESARAGRPVIAEYHRLLATLPKDALPHLRKLVDTPRDATASFSERILTVLVGIAVRRGEPWQRIVDLQPVADEAHPPVGLMHP